MSFIIQELKNKHFFLKTEKAKSSHFDRTRGGKNQIFPTKVDFRTAPTTIAVKNILLKWLVCKKLSRIDFKPLCYG